MPVASWRHTLVSSLISGDRLPFLLLCFCFISHTSGCWGSLGLFLSRSLFWAISSIHAFAYTYADSQLLPLAQTPGNLTAPLWYLRVLSNPMRQKQNFHSTPKPASPLSVMAPPSAPLRKPLVILDTSLSIPPHLHIPTTLIAKRICERCFPRHLPRLGPGPCSACVPSAYQTGGASSFFCFKMFHQSRKHDLLIPSQRITKYLLCVRPRAGGATSF